MRAFIEEQFPVSRLSKESYKERKSASGQTLTGLGKWWGRKPLVLVRGLLYGALLPASLDPEKDREVFLRIMTMDPDGLWQRKLAKGAKIKASRVAELLVGATEGDPDLTAALAAAIDGATYRKTATKEQVARVEHAAFERMPNDEQLTYCLRPEEIDGPSPESWAVINTHLGTSSSTLQELTNELSTRRFGHPLRVGDAFAGGGSIPFEAARLGAEAYAGDLNPVAVLLTWAALHIAGADETTAARIRASQEQLLADLRAFVDTHGLETNAEGWRAEAYLYCNEVKDPISGYLVPLAPSWIVSEKEGVYAELTPDKKAKRFEITIKTGGSKDDLRRAKEEATWSGGLRSPVGVDDAPLPVASRHPISGESLRGPGGANLRRWENDDLVPRPDDLFQERLFAIRWRTPDGTRVYRAPDAADLAREARVLELLRTHFADWQAQGFIPSAEIAAGQETDRPARERGWTRWHHLFAPRQLLLYGYLSGVIANETNAVCHAAGITTLGYLISRESRMAGWGASVATVTSTFGNQALNTTVLWPVAGDAIRKAWFVRPAGHGVSQSGSVVVSDARVFPFNVDLFITDPPYADMVNYEELTEFFTAWYAGHTAALAALIPGWGPDTLRDLAIKGSGASFAEAMTAAYRRLCEQMDDEGFHIVTFTHQDIAVWRDLAAILWSAGFRVSAAWNIATETSSGLKQGNYVQGTICMVLRKRRAGRGTGFLDDIYATLEEEIDRQIASMREHDDKERPDFGDADLQIAAYAAALRVITDYDEIAGIDLPAILRGETERSGAEELRALIATAGQMASDRTIPRGISRELWRHAAPAERFYLMALAAESRGEARQGEIEKLAKGAGLQDWTQLLASTAANEARVATPSELGEGRVKRLPVFGEAPLRLLLAAIARAVEADDSDAGRLWLRDELPGRYFDERRRLMEYLAFLADLPVDALPHWRRDAAMARRLLSAIAAEHA